MISTWKFTRMRGLLYVLIIAGCARSTDQNRGDAAKSGAVPDTAPAESSTAPHDTTVSIAGYGLVRPGMSIAEAEQVLGRSLVSPGPRMDPCWYVQMEGRLDPVFMVIDGRIARVDVQSVTVKTAEGAGIGDSEARIDSLYAGRVEVQPHKYVMKGHYLIVRSATVADSSDRIIFETDGKRVTQYRAGRMPEVGWIEGCS